MATFFFASFVFAAALALLDGDRGRALVLVGIGTAFGLA